MHPPCTSKHRKNGYPASREQETIRSHLAAKSIAVTLYQAAATRRLGCASPKGGCRPLVVTGCPPPLCGGRPRKAPAMHRSPHVVYKHTPRTIGPRLVTGTRMTASSKAAGRLLLLLSDPHSAIELIERMDPIVLKRKASASSSSTKPAYPVLAADHTSSTGMESSSVNPMLSHIQKR